MISRRSEFKLGLFLSSILLLHAIIQSSGEDYKDSTNKKIDEEIQEYDQRAGNGDTTHSNPVIQIHSSDSNQQSPAIGEYEDLETKSHRDYWRDRNGAAEANGNRPYNSHVEDTEAEIHSETPVETVPDNEDAIDEDRVREDEDDHVQETPKNKDERPNIILIMTDDQDIELGSMEYMPETLKIFRDDGVEFRHGYVTTPMCCPSRSSLLSGLYVHNHEVYTNNDNCSSVHWREKYEKKTFAAHLWSSGYYTSYIGKYLNKYDGYHIPYGWDEWNGLLMNSRFYNYTVNKNGRRFRHGNDYQSDYYPDVIANDTLEFLTRIGNDETKRPFLLVASFPSPHGPEDSAPQYSDLFFNATPHHTPNYNYAPNSDKQWILRNTNRMTPILKDFTNLLMTKRLQTLQSVDQAVKAIFDKLKAAGLQETTYVFYTSDHGYHVGQFGLVKGKSMPYEFDIRVPFFLHGPKSVVNPGSKIYEAVLNIDLAPTFLELANVPVPYEMDGRSMVPLINHHSPGNKEDTGFVWKDVFLIESSGRREPPNPGTVSSVTSSKKSKKQREERRKFLYEDNETMRMNNLCLLHPHPCLPSQKKYCRKDKEKVQFRKCRQFDFIGNGFSSIYESDSLYQISSNGSNDQPQSLKRCRCRFRRNAHVPTELFDWDVERKKIDDEIEDLKNKIEELRQKRKEMRRIWMLEQMESNNRKGKSENEDPYMVGSDGTSVFKIHDYRDFVEPSGNDTKDKNKEENVDFREGIHHSEETDDEDDRDEDLEELEEELGNTETDVVEDHHQTSDTGQPEPHEITKNTTTSEISITELRVVENPPKENDQIELGLDFEGNFDMVLKPHHKQRGRNKSKDRHKSRFPDLIEGINRETEGAESSCDCSNDPRWIRQKEREDRKRKKLLSKIRKKQKYMKRIEDPALRKKAETCGAEEKMNCFWHDSEHWKTAPLWKSGSFCFCMNSNNNTYSCLRSVNSTHNYLYCQFVTGFKMYFDLRQDPYQLKNAIGTLPAAEEDWMLVQLHRLKKCKGKEECWAEGESSEEPIQSSIWEQIFGRWPKKKKRGNRKRHF